MSGSERDSNEMLLQAIDHSIDQQVRNLPLATQIEVKYDQQGGHHRFYIPSKLRRYDNGGVLPEELRSLASLPEELEPAEFKTLGFTFTFEDIFSEDGELKKGVGFTELYNLLQYFVQEVRTDITSIDAANSSLARAKSMLATDPTHRFALETQINVSARISNLVLRLAELVVPARKFMDLARGHITRFIKMTDPSQVQNLLPLLKFSKDMDLEECQTLVRTAFGQSTDSGVQSLHSFFSQIDWNDRISILRFVQMARENDPAFLQNNSLLQVEMNKEERVATATEALRTLRAYVSDAEHLLFARSSEVRGDNPNRPEVLPAALQVLMQNGYTPPSSS